MTSSSPPRLSSGDTAPADSPLEQLDRVLNALSDKALSETREHDFVEQMLHAALTVTSVAGAQYWELNTDRPARLVLQTVMSPDLAEWLASSTVARQMPRILDAVQHQPHGTTILPADLPADHAADSTGSRQLTPGDNTAAAPSHAGSGQGEAARFLWLIAPIRLEQELYGVLLAYGDPHAAPAVQQGWLQLLLAVGEVSVPFFQKARVSRLQGDSQFWRDACRYAGRLQGISNGNELASTIVNEARLILQVDRAWWLVRRGGQALAVAASGVSQVDRRGASCRGLERLVGLVGKTGKPMTWSAGEGEVEPRSVRERLQDYIEESHVRALRIVPVTAEAAAGRRPRILGWLCVEMFSAEPHALLAERSEVLAGLAGLAYRSWSRRRGWWNWLLPWTWTSLSARMVRTLATLGAILALGIAAAVWIPADYRIEARGTLQPVVRQHVFAPEEGRVVKLNVRTGDLVEALSPLVQLRNEQIELDRERLQGELQTAQKRLSAIEAARLDYQSNGGGTAAKYNELSAELEQIQEQIRSLRNQQELLRRRMASLEITSPIAGQVLTWNLEMQLEQRPVRRGERLLTVAAVQGDWRLEIQIPDDLVGDVLSAQKPGATPLAVEYTLVSQPGNWRRSHLDEILPSTELRSAEAGPAVLAYVPVDAAGLAEKRAGTSVVAFIECGRKPLGYVWFIRLWRMLEREYWF